MAVLSDSDIVSLLREDTLRIEGFREENLTPNGYDVTVDEVWVPGNGSRFREGTAEIPGREWFVIGTKEFLELPPNIVGEIWIRTTWMRKGILSSFGRIDAGFKGNLTFSAFNASSSPTSMPIGERFAQVVFEEMRSTATKAYDRRSGNYQGQRGITLSAADHQRNSRSKA
ncbi:MAG: dCTP deaminase [Methanobacteriota archaeon]|nr:MAG: dCTP deaminase [Euryarchaeota archaeon]